MRAVEIEPCTWNAGLVIRRIGFEQLRGPVASTYVPIRSVFHFPTIDAARDFCRGCGFTWSVKATP